MDTSSEQVRASNALTTLTTWATRKSYIYATALLTGMFLILTIILSKLGIAGAWMSVMTGFAAAASLIYLFVHIYIISFKDLKNF